MSDTTWIHELRERLAAPPPRRLPPRESTEAAVLVPLYVDGGELWTVFTRRSPHLTHHRNQVAFPGGAREAGEDAWAAALRESEEELGIDHHAVLRLGMLDEADTPTGYRIIPCVAAVPYPLQPRVNEDEVAEVFSIPLLAFANSRIVEDRPVKVDGVERWIRVYHVGRHQVWGLTARILQNLIERLGVEAVPLEAPQA